MLLRFTRSIITFSSQTTIWLSLSTSQPSWAVVTTDGTCQTEWFRFSLWILFLLCYKTKLQKVLTISWIGLKMNLRIIMNYLQAKEDNSFFVCMFSLASSSMKQLNHNSFGIPTLLRSSPITSVNIDLLFRWWVQPTSIHTNSEDQLANCIQSWTFL